MAGVMGTSIVRVFGQTAGATGLTMTAARRLGVDAKAVYVVGKDHAGYYPGAEQLTLKLVYEAGTGRVLGAQAVGANGVDKRIDVIATAMAFGATVEQLAGVDLAYAPQFGSAKDPVHIAAFAAANEIAGFVDFVSPEASLTGHQIVDVRSAQEVTEYPHPCAPGARHIPLDELRDRIGELDPALSTIVLCGTGLRAHVAVRMLKQHGFNHVKNLSGGYVLRNRARLAGLIPDCQAQTSSQETHHASHHTR
jgi:rhodanese-related sulfurtransferase